MAACSSISLLQACARGCRWCARSWPEGAAAAPGAAPRAARSAAPPARQRLRGQGRPAGPSPAGRCAAPLRPEGAGRYPRGARNHQGAARLL